MPNLIFIDPSADEYDVLYIAPLVHVAAADFMLIILQLAARAWCNRVENFLYACQCGALVAFNFVHINFLYRCALRNDYLAFSLPLDVLHDAPSRSLGEPVH
jgi:hypothetical protein